MQGQNNWGNLGSPGVMKLWVAWEVLRWLMKFRELCSRGFHPKLVKQPNHNFLNVNPPPNFIKIQNGTKCTAAAGLVLRLVRTVRQIPLANALGIWLPVSHAPSCIGTRNPQASLTPSTLVSQIVEHTEIDEHLEQIAENLIVEHLIYTIFIATNNRTSGIFFHCVNSQTRLTIRDTIVVSLTSPCCSGWPASMNTPQGQQRDLSSDVCADFSASLESDLVLIINFNSTHK